MPNMPWIDIETTGLDPHAPGAKILEIALVVTNSDLEEIGRQTHVVQHDLPDAELETWHSRVQDMHMRSGLVLECRESKSTLEQIDQQVALQIRLNARGQPIAGQSVYFDFKWIQVHMPKTAAALHGYRIFDARTLITAAEAWGGFNSRDLGGAVAHRAEADIDWSLACCRYVQEVHFA